MQQRNGISVVVAAVVGGMFGAVTTIEGAVARSVGALGASFIEHAMTALIAVPAVIIMFARGNLNWETTRSVIPISGVAGVLVIISVAGVAYAMPRVGITAGNMAMLLGQMTIAVLIDTIGVGGYDKVPITWPRVAGLVLMIAGVYLVLPRSN